MTSASPGLSAMRSQKVRLRVPFNLATLFGCGSAEAVDVTALWPVYMYEILQRMLMLSQKMQKLQSQQQQRQQQQQQHQQKKQ
mmetsp:Transcript_4193/g.8385  ORF Transcript_4193/g.8385 Transcript_4193/m.8385 type:complete len:83 (-) Transcript_4193:5-253(-)